MKKLLSTVVLGIALLFSTSANAQVKFGLKGGLNVTRMSLNTDLLKEHNRTGFFIGPTVKFTLPIIGLGVDASALYDQRDAKVSESNETGEKTLSQKQIAVPINLRYGIGLGSTASVFLFAGPQFGFNVGDKTQELFSAAMWKLKSSNLSVNVGAGLMLFKHLQATVNYNIACGKTGEFTVDGAVTNYKSRNNAWQLGLAYYF